MEQFIEQRKQNFKNERLSQLAESLSAMRVAEIADVTLSCGDTDFPAHKLILEASSSYFEKMFNTDLEEAKSGYVVFKELEPQTLDAILDFIYLGDISNIKTEEQVRNVLAASHLMGLEQLFEYCFDAFIASLSIENCVQIWDYVMVFEKEDMEKKILDFIVANYNEFESSSEILSLTFNQMQRFLNYVKLNVPSLDDILMGILRWLLHDVNERDHYAKALFACLDALLVSKDLIKMLSKDDDVMTSSTEIASGIKDLFFMVYTLADRCNIVEPSSTSQPDQSRKLIFFSEYRMKETQLGHTTTSCVREMRPQSYNCVQQFDLLTMTWQPLKKLCCCGYRDAAMFQYERKIYMLGGSLGSTGIVYNIDENSVDYLGNCTMTARKNAGISVVDDQLYLIGGSVDSRPTTLVERSTLSNIVSGATTKWEKLLHLQNGFTNPTVITSPSFIYVMGDSKLVHIDYIEYINIAEGIRGCLKMAEIPSGVNLHVTVVGHTVFGLYCECEATMMMTNSDITKNNWHVTVLNESLLNITEMVCIPQYPNGPPVVYVSLGYGLRIPDYLWEPESGKWTRLPPSKGRCEIPNDDTIPKVFAVGI